jgi:hypothetical protein
VRALAAATSACDADSLTEPSQDRPSGAEKSTPCRAALSRVGQQVAACGQTIAGRSPAGSQEGHAAGSERLATDVAEWLHEQEAPDDRTYALKK